MQRDSKFRVLFFLACATILLFASALFLSIRAATAETHPMVRLIYFLPNDRQPQPDIDEKMDTLIKKVQQSYSEMMENHGFGDKTFEFETDRDGNAVVHHIDGEFADAYYFDETVAKVLKEVRKQFDTSERIYLIAINSNYHLTQREAWGNFDGIGGWTLVPTEGIGFGVGVSAHELGHAFGLGHDYRQDVQTIPTSYTWDPMITSFCAAEWLDVHRYFNAGRQDRDASRAEVQMLPPALVSPPNTIRLRFEVTDLDGLHQAQLHIAEGTYSGGLIAYQSLNGTKRVIEFTTSELVPENGWVSLRVIDVSGNFTLHDFPIDVISLLPPSRVISMPDVNLAAAVREALNLNSDAALTSHKMLELTYLNAPDRQITDLTGLEYALNLKELWVATNVIDGQVVSRNAVSDLSPIQGLTKLYWLQLANPSRAAVSMLPRLTRLKFLQIYHTPIIDASVISELTQLEVLQIYNSLSSDVSVLVPLGPALAGFTRLRTLTLYGVSISDTDVSAISRLPQLKSLEIDGVSISDISPLSELLTQLDYLGLQNTSVSDISSLEGLTELRGLTIGHSPISDISSLAGLTQLRELRLDHTSVSDVSPLVGLTELRGLTIGHSPISDISSLAGLTRLRELGLWYTSVSDVSPLVGLTELSWLNLVGSPLSYASIHTHIPTMQTRGIDEVRFDNHPRRSLVKVSGDGQTSRVSTALATPFVVAVYDERGEPMKGVSVRFTITSGGGVLSATTATTNAAGSARTILTLGRTPGTNTVRATANGIASFVIFNASVGDPPMYWIDTAKGTLHRRTGTTVGTLIPSVRNATSLAVDVRGGKLYWTEQTGNTTGKIRRADLDGSNVQLVKNLTSVPHDIALDTINRKIYLINSWEKVQQMNLDGSNFQPNLITGLDAPQDVALDVRGGKLYWTEKTSDSTGNIRRANLDGSQIALVKALTSVPRGLVVDTVNGKIYLANASGKVQRMNLDGSNFQPNLITGLDAPQDVALDVRGGKLYWTERGSINRANLNGENVEAVATGVGAPARIALSLVPVEAVIAAAPAQVTIHPEATGLLHNYPNPFNPETWIPYQLAKPAEVTLTIYAINGTLVRTLALGHQPAGLYHGKNRAAYWDGRNALGERVASGVYFYTLTAGDFAATRKMLILK